jgi:NAD(P)-dependent dehydrogenase (short-subunit alcohol dehydrogenase family)
MPDWQLAWITGASTGIGRGLALKLAERGVRCAVSARSGEKLDELAAESTLISPYPADVTDPAAIAKTVAAIEAAHGPIDLTILNAGIWEPMRAFDFDAQRAGRSMQVNYMGVVNGVEAVLPGMIKRDRGHIAIVASVAGYRGLPQGAAYSPTKAALINLAESLATDLDGTGVKITVINPGFIDTPMTRNNEFLMPFIITADEAVDEIMKGLDKDKFEIAFPRTFVTLLKVARGAPYPMFFWMVRNFIRPKL